ncbi:MAG: alanine racemase [Lachnospiraceae bacterium]|nr:alanine racemase [Lachnospiraceae bacterium]
MRNDLRTYVVVDLDAIADNIRAAKARILPDVKMMAVIKADAYGHGALEVGKYLQDEVDYFAVAEVEEGVALREAGLTLPIMILGYTMKAQYPELIKYDIEQTVYRIEDACLLGKIAVSMGKKAIIHIAVDTGMGRIGFVPNEESADCVKEISKIPGIVIKGIFTHFSTADEADKTYTRQQMEQYDRFVRLLAERGVEIPVKHVCNSAGIMEFEDHRYDMVRSGIITYGLYPSEEVKKENLSLKPALEWKAHVAHVKTAGPGLGISYGKTFVTTADQTKIATINIGYADGYPRALSNKGRVLIHGKSAPVIGRVCMDQFMVDITGIEDVQVEDEVTLIGRDGEEFISVEEAAETAGTFNYEFVCDIGKRVPRVYKGSKL